MNSLTRFQLSEGPSSEPNLSPQIIEDITSLRYLLYSRKAILEKLKKVYWPSGSLIPHLCCILHCFQAMI